MNDAEECRRNGWSVGCFLVGEEHGVTAAILVTAIGEDHLLARCVAKRKGAGVWEAVSVCEGLWTLSCRDWHEASNAECRDIHAAMAVADAAAEEARA